MKNTSGCQIFWLTIAVCLAAGACAQVPLEDTPTYLLYVDDISYSTLESDPNGFRSAIFEGLVNNNPTASFAVISFSSSVYVETVDFTQDHNILNALLPDLNKNLDGGAIGNALLAVTQYLTNSVTSQGSYQSQDADYYVYFISTGIPTDGNTNPNSLVPFVTSLTQFMVPRVKHFEFDTAFLSNPNSNFFDPVQTLESRTFMAELATAGHGAATELTSSLPDSFVIPRKTTKVPRK